MATMTLLEIISAVCNELGLNAPTSVINSTDLQIKQLYALANREGNELYRTHPWTFINREYIINVDAPLTFTGDVTLGSTDILTLVPTTGAIEANLMAVSGSGMPQSQRVTSILSSDSVRCEMEATETEVGATLTFAKDTYGLPTDFDHYVSNTWWDRTNHWQLIGPISPQIDQWQRSGIVATGPRLRWRQIGVQPNVFRLWPAPTAQTTPDALVFEYISNGWVENEAGTYQASFTADTDVPLVNPQAMILGIKWRFWQIKGFDYAPFQAEYVDFVNREKARDGGMADLNMNNRPIPFLLGYGNVQDGNFPGS